MGGTGGYFTAAEASAITRVPLSTLNYWARTGVITPSRRGRRPRLYSFDDVCDLRVAQELREQRARLPEIRSVLAFVRTNQERLADAELHLVGTRIVYRNRALGIDPVEPATGGQRVLTVPMAKLFNGSGDARALRPAERIVIRPDVRGGTPVLAGTRVPAQLVAELAAEGVPREEIVAMYPALTAADVDAAVGWQRDLGG
jgi:uncharacterized protein (DUF433 family)/DNA-binding transcriptional MerR regulator